MTGAVLAVLPVFAVLPVDPFDLVRVEDPRFPGADAVSETGAVLLEPPPDGIPWSWELVPEVDSWPATEALEALNVQPWHDRGVTGAGVKVAVFDIQYFGADVDPDELGPVSTHDCYRHASCALPLDTFRPRFAFEEGVHGFACAEVIRDIAPDADLHLVRVNGGTTLENAVSWAIREGIDIVSMSMSFFNGSFYDGGGFVSSQMDRLAAAGVLMVTSAGNYAEGHWNGAWVDADGDGLLDFGGDGGLPIRFGAGTGAVHVNWNQHRSCGTTDLDVILRDADGAVVGRSEDTQRVGADRCAPVERLRAHIAETGWYTLEVRLRRGSTAGLRVDVLSTAGRVHGSMPEGSITDPGVHPDVLTVGAVRAQGYRDNEPEPFSSWGPSLGGVPKPEIAGPDGLTTRAYGAVGFYGTSAATPAVAGALALVMSEDPTLTPFQAAERLKGWAWGGDPLFVAPDPRWGAGKARLPERPEEPSECGRRPLLLPLLVPPLLWSRRRRGR